MRGGDENEDALSTSSECIDDDHLTISSKGESLKKIFTSCETTHLFLLIEMRPR